MASEATVRHATREDVPVILALIHELAAYENATSSVFATEEKLLSTLSFAPSQSLATDLSTTTTSFTPGFAKTLLLSTPEGEIVGMALYFNNYSTWHAAPGIYLEDLYVKKEYRKRGYGKRLIKELAMETVRIGGKRLEWSCLDWNTPSLEFYESLGAKKMGEWVGLRVEGENLGKLAEGQR